jgi:hypothetical protein
MEGLRSRYGKDVADASGNNTACMTDEVQQHTARLDASNAEALP